MSYKTELANKISNHYKSSIVAAEEINDVWSEIHTYFYELNLSLSKVIELLGNHVNFSDDGKIIEFKLGENGIRFVKEIFRIQAVKIYPGSAELMAILEFKDKVVVNEATNEAFSESLIDHWVKEAIEVHLN